MENKILKATKNVLPPTFIPIRGEMLVEIRYIPHNLSKDEAKYFVKWDNHCMNYQWTQRIKHANCAQLAKEV